MISLYDNAAHGTEDGRGREVHTHPFSQGKIIELDTVTWTASIVQAFQPPDGLLSKSQGSTQLLPNGNALVNWGSEGALTEFRSDGTPIYHAYMDSGFLGEGVENYRAFRYNWTGLPHETPAIVSLENDEATTVYVSWNGDTETKTWRFFNVLNAHGSREFLGELRRTGFETAFAVKGAKLGAVSADAVDANGRILRSTGIAKTKAEVIPAGMFEGGSAALSDDVQFRVQPTEKFDWKKFTMLKIHGDGKEQ